jgi:hypothetical protein
MLLARFGAPTRQPMPALRCAERVVSRCNNEVSIMTMSAWAQISAVVLLFMLSFFCFLGGAALRRWPGKVQGYMERVDGSLLFVSGATHRALIYATSFALTGLSIIALVAARFVG